MYKHIQDKGMHKYSLFSSKNSVPPVVRETPVGKRTLLLV